MNKIYSITAQVIIIFGIYGCSTKKENITPSNSSDIRLYQNGLNLLEKGKYTEAIIEFDNLFLNYPFSPLANKADIMLAYSLYQNNEINMAVQKLQSFIEFNPKGELSAYAHYLLAMCYYIQISSEGRDSSLTKKALNHFKKIVTKYPNTKYAKDSEYKIKFIKNSLARNELKIAVFYLKNNSPASSIKRLRSIIKSYQNTSVIPETLYRLSEALFMIGLQEEAKKSNAILSYNFPNNKWTKLSQKLLVKQSNSYEDENITDSIKNFLETIFD